MAVKLIMWPGRFKKMFPPPPNLSKGNWFKIT